MTDYLIAHVVHGAAEFGIASKMEEGTPSDPGPWWILTGGWRAYPYWICPLNELFIKTEHTLISLFLPEAPANWPDFIKKREEKKLKPIRLSTKIDLEELGL